MKANLTTFYETREILGLRIAGILGTSDINIRVISKISKYVQSISGFLVYKISQGSTVKEDHAFSDQIA